jgi:hypothetical protein
MAGHRRTDRGASAGYAREVRAELQKKGAARVADERLFQEVVDRSFRSSVHPRACAGVILIASGNAPKKMPKMAGLCCGQR